MRLKDKICIVTGAAQGIGRPPALKFAAEGATVIVCDLREPPSTRRWPSAAPSVPADGHAVDVTDREQVDAMVAAVLAAPRPHRRARQQRRHHQGRAAAEDDAGAVRRGHRRQPARRLPLRAGGRGDDGANSGAGRDPERQQRGRLYGNFGQTNYAASKFGVIGFTKTWSRELGPKGVRVNAVAPGFIETPILASIPDKVLQHMREQVPLQPPGPARRDRQRLRLPGQRRGQLHQRRGDRGLRRHDGCRPSRAAATIRADVCIVRRGRQVPRRPRDVRGRDLGAGRARLRQARQGQGRQRAAALREAGAGRAARAGAGAGRRDRPRPGLGIRARGRVRLRRPGARLLQRQAPAPSSRPPRCSGCSRRRTTSAAPARATSGRRRPRSCKRRCSASRARSSWPRRSTPGPPNWRAGSCPAPVREQLYQILFKPDKNAPEYKAVVEASRARSARRSTC